MYYVIGFDTTIVNVAMPYWSWDFIHLMMIKKGDTFSTGLKSASISIWSIFIFLKLKILTNLFYFKAI